MLTLLNILAGIALLVWGTYLVRTSILRVYGAELRRFLSVNVDNRFMALLAGLGVTSLLQSSTATALLTTSFAGSGLIATAPALAILLGADIGTALAAMFLSRDLTWLSPLLIFVGVIVFLSKQRTNAEHLGRASIMSPRPMLTRPRCSAFVRCFDRNTMTPTKINSGDSQVKSRDRNTAASAVPMSAPSMMASAGAVAMSPLPANDVVSSAVAVELCRRLVTPKPANSAMKRLSTLTERKRRSSAP